VATHAPDVRLRRLYDDPADDDGLSVLVHRQWPCGVTKARVALDEWCTAVAPPDLLRRWSGHGPATFEEFGSRYRAEIDDPARASALQRLRQLPTDGRLTLFTVTRRRELSHAAILAELLRVDEK
jgi:uncharacterized protein YeaO (DUF488 family)